MALGILLALAYPPFNLWWSLPVPLLFYLSILQSRVGTGYRVYLFSFLFWLAFFFSSLWWILDFLHFFGGMPKILTPLPHLFLCSVLSLFMTAGLAAARLFPGSWFWWTYPLGIAFGEWIKAHIIWGGFPWNSLSLPLTHVPVLLQPASLIGSHGLSAWVVFLLIGPLVMARQRKILWAWPAILVALAAYSIVWMRHPEEGRKVKAVVVQTGVDERHRFTQGDDGQGLKEALGFSREAMALDPDLILWPESVFVGEFHADGSYGDVIELSKRKPLLIVANLYEAGKAYNSAFLLQDGKILGTYRKRHLVPFGEYLPLRGLAEKLGMIRVARSIADFSPGESPGFFPAPVPLGVSICFEAVFPQLVRQEVNHGALLLAGLTNDAWYGAGGAAEQHFRQAVIRCAELHRPLARAALTGISGFTDSHGRIQKWLPLGERGFMAADVELSGRPTFYAMVGDVLPALFGLSAGLLALFRGYSWIRRRRTTLPPEAVSR